MIQVEGSSSARWGSTLTCAECGGSNLIQDHETGETVCQTCGYVVARAACKAS
jgi:transcription initiation factor TFIIIB Brf1 subunit/transcription initiation factor TFIIB